MTRRVAVGSTVPGVPPPSPGGIDGATAMSRVLVVDDDPACAALAINLRAHGYEVDARPRRAVRARPRRAHRRPDVVVLDLGLPDMDGVEVIEGLRGWAPMPMIVLSAGRPAEKVEALDAGADDYVTKPFGMDELLARVRAAVRRGASPARTSRRSWRPRTSPSTWARTGSPRRRAGAADADRMVAARGAGAARGRLVPQRQLLTEVWGPAYEHETHYLRVYLAQLRRKLEPDPAKPRLPDHRAGDGVPVREGLTAARIVFDLYK